MAKVEGTVRSFRGKEDENLNEFWQKFQVVAKIQMLATGEDRMQYLPLYLSGDAFTVWSSMSEADKKDEDKVVARLRELTWNCLSRKFQSNYFSVAIC